MSLHHDSGPLIMTSYSLQLPIPFFSRNLVETEIFLKNDRTVSNLSFIYKLIEKVVAKQLNSYIDSPMLTSPLTGDYILQKQHSLKSKTTLLLQWTLVKLIDHNILFDCLRDWFGVMALF